MTEPEIFTLYRGHAPLLVSVPHAGQLIAPHLRGRLVERALEVEDTDWHLEQIYAFVRELGASLIVPQHSRYVIDLNRPPENTPMYSGVNNTELCPTRFFTGEPLYAQAQEPDPVEVEQRRARYWQPYHNALGDELARVKAQHGHVVLFDGHSIKGVLPWLFDGQLPDLNLGTVSGTSCAPSLSQSLVDVLAAQSQFTWVADGRFKGGYITRRYGAPAQGIHTVQLEKCWGTYMADVPPYLADSQRVAKLTPVLRALVQVMLAWRPQ